MPSIGGQRVTRLKILKLLLTFLLVLGAGCGRQVILVKPGTPIQLREEVRAVKVWVFDKDGVKVEGRVDLPVGWWCLADTGEDDQ